MKAQFNTPLSTEYEGAVLHIVRNVIAKPYDIFSDAPDTLLGVTNYYRNTGRLGIWDGACDTTVFSAPEVNHAFRVFHDWCHIEGQHAFNPEGEALACEAQKQMIRDTFGNTPQAQIACAMVHADIVGILEHRQLYGNFPTSQRAFIADYIAGDGWLTHGAY